ncbi:RHS repeat-associated core domain-containing protein [Rouxiella sp. WC2420]|uniref:RHS repeat-associated core domain-containing protein n=1 Tax=Rouxiella sp. WC2420 TaxID=3234145 RepID=A0AB39VLM1_9GAMM
MNNSTLGFNGERRDLISEAAHLGNGYRAYNPILMRFNSPDSWSPFGEGGLTPTLIVTATRLIAAILRGTWAGNR